MFQLVPRTFYQLTESDEKNGIISVEIFISIVETSDLPLNRAEALSIGHLLVRDNFTPLSSSKKGAVNKSVSTAINLSLLRNIKSGNYLNAPLK